MDRFLPYTDELGDSINNAAKQLYEKLKGLDVDRLGMPEGCLAYFKGSHFKRLFFSIETSAHLLYKCISMSGKSRSELTIMDYGAGVGTLYTLAKLAGCGKVIYNDHLNEWKESARLIAAGIGIEVDEYIVGDIDVTLTILEKKNIRIDIVTSRNVIEHIYQLDYFYTVIAKQQPQAIIYSSTTANYRNPASRIKHWLLHNRVDKQYYFEVRKKIILQKLPSLDETTCNKLAQGTRGLALEGLNSALMHYRDKGVLVRTQSTSSNTCDPETGVWAEHMISFADYRKLIRNAGYEAKFEAGCWDTHYSNPLLNLLGATLNVFIRMGAECLLAPFIYVIATPAPINNHKSIK
jgi:hypothetical protein